MAGRPTDYSPEEVLKITQEYIDACQDEEEQVISGQSDKFTSYKQKTIVKLPTIEGLAYELRVHKDTVYEWEKHYPEFSDLLNVLRGKQAKELINKGLSGDYNPIIAKLLLMKHGYADKSEITADIVANVKYTGIEVVKPNEVPPQSDSQTV